jgi:hypothetical protein
VVLRRVLKFSEQCVIASLIKKGNFELTLKLACKRFFVIESNDGFVLGCVTTITGLARPNVPYAHRGEHKWNKIVIHLAISIAVPGEIDLVCLCLLTTTNE